MFRNIAMQRVNGRLPESFAATGVNEVSAQVHGLEKREQLAGFEVFSYLTPFFMCPKPSHEPWEC